MRQSKQTTHDKIKVYLAVLVAERIVFGDHLRTAGSANDIALATSIIARSIRALGFDKYVSLIVPPTAGGSEMYCTNMDETNPQINKLLKDAEEEVEKLLEANKDTLIEIGEVLIKKGQMSSKEFHKLLSRKGIFCEIKGPEYEIT